MVSKLNSARENMHLHLLMVLHGMHTAASAWEGLFLSEDPVLCRVLRLPEGCRESGNRAECPCGEAFRYGGGWILVVPADCGEVYKSLRCVQIPYVDLKGVAVLGIIAAGIAYGLDMLKEWKVKRNFDSRT